MILTKEEPMDPLTESSGSESSISKKSSTKKKKSSSSSTSSRSSRKSSSSRSKRRSGKKKEVHREPNSEPMTLVDVLTRGAVTSKIAKDKYSCMNRNKKKKPEDKKKLRFATNVQTDKVWTLVREYEKEDKELRMTLFWDSDELYETYASDKKVVDNLESQYFNTLKGAYKSSLQQGSCEKTIELDEDAMAMCSKARGLEIDVFPYLRDFAKRHTEEVLSVQDYARRQGRTVMSAEDCEEMRQTSIKYSKGNRLVATRMAQFDSDDSHYSLSCKRQD